MPILAVFALCIIAAASVAVTLVFVVIARALVANTESVRLLVEHLDARMEKLMSSVQKSIEDVKEITERVNGQMDRVEHIVENIENVTRDASSSMKMVDATVVPTLSNLHSIVGGLRKGYDTWKSGGAEAADEQPGQ